MEPSGIEKIAEQLARILVAQIEGEAKAGQEMILTGSMAGSDTVASREGKSELTNIT